jgi:hypothetical protein
MMPRVSSQNALFTERVIFRADCKSRPAMKLNEQNSAFTRVNDLPVDSVRQFERIKF